MGHGRREDLQRWKILRGGPEHFRPGSTKLLKCQRLPTDERTSTARNHTRTRSIQTAQLPQVNPSTLVETPEPRNPPQATEAEREDLNNPGEVVCGPSSEPDQECLPGPEPIDQRCS